LNFYWEERVQGPLKLLKKSWLDEENQVSLLEQVMQLLQGMRRAAQMMMKAWYNRTASKRSFKVGDEVLILLPPCGQPLQAWYSGPYTINKKVNEVDYIVTTPDRRKEKRLCHIKMLKLYQTRQGEEPRKQLVQKQQKALKRPLKLAPS